MTADVTNHALLDFLRRRRSIPSRTLGAPGPDERQLHDILEAAVCVPDHGRLTPWRFLRIAGDARVALGNKLLDVYRGEHPDAGDGALDKERSRFTHAPLIVAVIGRIAANHKIPEIEQRLSAGAVCLQLLQAAAAMGFGAQWLTGWAAYHPEVQAFLGLTENEEVIGFVHVGTATGEPPAYRRPDIDSLLVDWKG